MIHFELFTLDLIAKKSNSKMKLPAQFIFAIMLLYLVFIRNVSCQNLYETPTHMFDSGLKDGTIIKISPDNQNFIVGYSSGLLKAYKTSSGSLVDTLQIHTDRMIHIIWQQENLITIDLSGLIVKWNSQFQIIARWNVPTLSKNCASIKIGQIVYISFIYQTTIQEYIFQGVSMTRGVTFTIDLTQFQLSIYDPTHSYLYATLMSGQNIIYYVANQTQKMRFRTNSNFRLMSMDLIRYQSSVYIIATDRNNLYQINQNGIVKFSSQYGETVINCKNHQFFILTEIWRYFKTINSQTFEKIQYLGYSKSALSAVACSDQYIVSTDQQGWITINQYQQSRPLTIIIMSIIFVGIIITIFIANKKLIKNNKSKAVEENSAKIEQRRKDQYEKLVQNNQVNQQ